MDVSWTRRHPVLFAFVTMTAGFGVTEILLWAMGTGLTVWPLVYFPLLSGVLLWTRRRRMVREGTWPSRSMGHAVR